MKKNFIILILLTIVNTAYAYGPLPTAIVEERKTSECVQTMAANVGWSESREPALSIKNTCDATVIIEAIVTAKNISEEFISEQRWIYLDKLAYYFGKGEYNCPDIEWSLYDRLFPPKQRECKTIAIKRGEKIKVVMAFGTYYKITGRFVSDTEKAERTEFKLEGKVILPKGEGSDPVDK
ncbi:MAG: hypothetical protein IT560_14425 [Alphaproteobacteria bacterium]|nr:hypothetical protein [Alphaproteobacteria bacterium]